MDLEVVTVGTELLLGFTLDSNAADIGRLLAPIGWRVVRRTTVADEPEAIRDAVSQGLSRTGFVLVTGGLGPTHDDVTKRAVASLFDAPLQTDAAYLETLRQRFAKLGRGRMPEANRSQAEVPQGATMLPNRRGTAPGLWLEGKPGTAVMLPGIPREVRELMKREVVPRLNRLSVESQSGARITCSRTLRTTGVSESRLAEEIESVANGLGGVSLAYLPGVEGVDIRLTAWNVPGDSAGPLLEAAVEVVRPVLGEHLYGEDDVCLAAVVLERLRQTGRRLAVAESCTGGLVGAKLASVPGASDVFAGGVVCYENVSKVRDLGVPEALIAEYGAVSGPVARAMAEGVCRRFETEVGAAVTGIAGPTGGSSEKPVGTVWIASRVGSAEQSRRRWFPGERDEVRHRGAQAALDLARRMLNTW